MDRDDKALRRIISQLTGEWQSQAEEAADALFELLKKGKPLAVALRIIKEQYAELFTIPHLQDALVESACAGFGVSVSSLDKQTIAKVGHALSESWTGDELITLSQRIRGMGEEMSRTIVDTISAQMRANQSWIEASRALYDGYDGGHLLEQADIPEYLKKVRRATQGSPEALKEARKALGNIDRLSRNGAPTKALKAAYSELVDSALIGTEEQMEKAVHTAMEEKSRYIADRIIRTENARAWADGFIARADADEDCIGYEWVMDTRHPVIDICDFHSQVDAFGMGPGKFPKGKAPAMPAHPHCLCRFIEVYKSKNQPKDQRAKAGREWLEELSEQDRKRVLGKQGAEAFDKGKDWVKSSKNLKLGKQESRLKHVQHELMLQLHASQENAKIKSNEIKNLPRPGDFVINARGQKVLVVNHLDDYGEPNSATQVFTRKGGVNRNYYGDDGSIVLQVTNNDHGNPKEHPFGEHGEHSHTIVKLPNGDFDRQKAREMTTEEREANADLL